MLKNKVKVQVSLEIGEVAFATTVLKTYLRLVKSDKGKNEAFKKEEDRQNAESTILRIFTKFTLGVNSCQDRN